jgi:hypothetical protein
MTSGGDREFLANAMTVLCLIIGTFTVLATLGVFGRNYVIVAFVFSAFGIGACAKCLAGESGGSLLRQVLLWIGLLACGAPIFLLVYELVFDR